MLSLDCAISCDGHATGLPGCNRADLYSALPSARPGPVTAGNMATRASTDMQSLHNLSRDELIALVEALELRATPPQATPELPPQQDFLVRQMLAALDDNRVPALVYDGGKELAILAAN